MASSLPKEARWERRLAGSRTLSTSIEPPRAQRNTKETIACFLRGPLCPWWLSFLGADQFFLFAGFVFDDVARDGARRHCERRSQVQLSRAAASREVAVLRADHDLIRTSRNSGT